MNNNSLSPLSVVEFSRDYLIEFVRYKTGWDQRNEVSDKTQLTYLCNYLAAEHIKCKTIVVEDEYIDRHYLEDYSEYYARCFPFHPRKCSRLHFFSSPITQHEFVKGLTENNDTLKNTLTASYIGFAVIRPIPHTFFAKLCLIPYSSFGTRSASKIILKDVPVSLFGIPLNVKTLPFLEQDKVVSACATSAVWTALNATSEIPHSNVPSPSAITKAASHGHYEGARTFPTVGLTPLQVARSLKHFGIEPSIFWCNIDGDRSDFKEHIYSYIQSSTPVIMGGDVYEATSSGQHRYLGKHLVCVVGYNTSVVEHGRGLRLLSHEIDKIYIHDDRYGPFVKVKMASHEFKFDNKTLTGLALAINGHNNDVFVPEVAIVGLNHKVRIPYSHIFNICTTFLAYAELTVQDLKSFLAPPAPNMSPEDIEHDADLVKHFQTVIDGIWDISLTSSVAIKQELLESKEFATFNGMLNKSSLLLQNMPKHVWRCRVCTRADQKTENFTDILFDATEVPQGRVLIGYISYSPEAQKMWNYVADLVSERRWQDYKLTNNDAKQFIGCIIKFFSELKGKTYLNTLYGPAGIPRRALKPGELDKVESIHTRQDTLTVRRGDNSSNWDFLRLDKKYIWVINELGDVVIGEDVQSTDGAGDTYFHGHPTLIDGKPGRVAGELIYVAEDKGWVINLRSRAYSGHLDARSDEAKGYLKSVIDMNLAGLPVKVQEDIPFLSAASTAPVPARAAP